MGRAIEHEKDIDKLKIDVAQLKTAFEGLASTVESLQSAAPSKKNIDLHEKVRPEIKKAKKKELVTEET
jgi:hypothetical protein